ncbi:sigma-54 dependent transcriptional regulator [Desulfosarcina alkanivorans]|uniref:HTH-type transcriptional regulatory protein TyrR n=1 Tax=Desulfosarcina alkanivorans TaxID=571177 RepID=A0A5K7YVP9_9BACT|nr:sigma 54-interacting transcriptional regulator [Desulfosarcina alkanivorans]BBO71141.1 sigma-54 dependent transcriptional regulator [Desulfosarcina alkanivorans]
MKPASPNKALPPSELNALLFSSRTDDNSARNWRLFSKALLDASGNAIFVLDPSGTVVLSNQRVQKSLGLFPGSLLPNTLPDFWPRVRQVIKDRKALSGLTVQAGESSYLARLAPMVFKDAFIGVLCVLEDRTELEKTTRKMIAYQELSRELDAIISSSDDGLFICDGSGTILRINAASERLNMVKAADVIGRNIHELVDEGYIDNSVTLKVTRSRRREHILQQTRSGKKLILTGNPVFNRSGELIRVVVNERDITEIDTLREELETQLAKNDQIQRRMQEMQIEELASGQIIARSANMVKALRQARKVSQVDSTVLLLGESGTGKGVAANLIHQHSDRAHNPMIIVNCGAIPETLVESELFGYEAGAFSGAAQHGKPGFFELADGGILFLDEVAELPIASQAKLLRFLEDGRVTRVGGTTPRALNVRVICATHRDLERMVAQGQFRLDLFYRLNVIPISIPPLREREACKLALIEHYIKHFNDKLKGCQPPRLSRRAMDALMAYHYPGNVRELMNICERLVVMSESAQIDVEDLPSALTSSLPPRIACGIGMMEAGQTLPQVMAAVERRLLNEALDKYGTQAKAASALGINQSTIARKLKRFQSA